MTRKDYIAIAEALRLAEESAVGGIGHGLPSQAAYSAVGDTINAAAHYIANAMQDDNPHFDRGHFLAVVRGERELQSRPKRTGNMSDAG